MTDKIKFYENQVFEDINFSDKIWNYLEFEECQFVGCDFTKSNLIGNKFFDCSFKNCNFSMTEIEGVSFRNAIFQECKMLGLDFVKMNHLMSSFRFDKCIMDYSIFFEANLKKTNFINCSLKDVDFTQANLTSAVFKNSNLARAIFSNTILEKADFRGALNFIVDPESNKLRKAIFSKSELQGLLNKYQLDITD